MTINTVLNGDNVYNDVVNVENHNYQSLQRGAQPPGAHPKRVSLYSSFVIAEAYLGPCQISFVKLF